MRPTKIFQKNEKKHLQSKGKSCIIICENVPEEERLLKIGLVLEGGANRTIFSCGVLDAFLDAGVMADYVIGASAGITYGVSYISQQKGRNRELMRRFAGTRRYAGIHHMFSPRNRSYYNLNYVFDTIPNRLLPFDYSTYNAFPGTALAAVTNIRTGEAEYLPVDGTDAAWQVLRATCALPLLFQPVPIGEERYADGGVADSIPYKKALEDGCDRVIVVLTRERGYVKTPEKMMGLAYRKFKNKYPDYAEKLIDRHERYNVCVEEIAQLEKQKVLYVIAPTDTLGVSRTDRDMQKLMALYAQGYALTVQQIPALRKYLHTV